MSIEAAAQDPSRIIGMTVWDDDAAVDSTEVDSTEMAVSWVDGVAFIPTVT